MDEQAKAEREKVYNDYVMQHEMAVVKLNIEKGIRQYDGYG